MLLLLILFLSVTSVILSLFFSLTKNHLISSTSSSVNHNPPSFPFIGCLISFYQNRSRLLTWYTDLLSKSLTQTIVIQRLGARRTIITANTSNVEYILKTNFANFPKGKPFTEILGDLLGCGIFNVDGELWSTQRKLASHEFSTKSLREFVVKTLEKEVHTRLVPLLENASENNVILDLQDVLKRFAFDAVCRVSLGIDPQSLDFSKPVPKLLEAFDNATEISAMRSMVPIFLAWKAKRVFNIGSEKKLKESISLVHYSILEIVKEKKDFLKKTSHDQGNNKSCDHDLLSRLLMAGHDLEVVRDMVISFVMAGRDTTSSAMTWLFWLLSRHPNTEEMILNEVNSIFNENGEMGFLKYDDLKEMNFLKACLCESMRLYPPVAWDSKHAIENDTLPDGTRVVKGDRVTYFPYGMGRMEELWGKDSFEFKPERWFDEPVDGGNRVALKHVSPYRFPIFQAGPRVCLGKEMAFIQMKYVVAEVLRRFEIRPVCDMNQPVFVPLLTAYMAGGLKVFIRKRVSQE